MKTTDAAHPTAPRILNFILFLVLLSITACQPAGPPVAVEKGGKKYGVTQGAFRHRWWNYYERGRSFADGAFYEKALADLKTAASKRKADQRRARTYGMHFVDYFPHREMGVIHFLKKNYPEAEKELEISIRQFPTAKAFFYLDKVRKARLERSSDDLPPPSLKVHLPSDEIWTKDDPVIISGTAEDSGFVAGVKIHGRPVFMEGSRTRVSFKEDFRLPGGKHAVEVTARNLLGRTASRRIVFHVDRQGPAISIDTIQQTARSRITVTGTAYDPAGVHGFSIDGRNLPVSQAVHFSFSETVERNGAEAVRLVFADRLGNRTSASVAPPEDGPATSSLMLAEMASDRPSAFRLAAVDTQPPKIEVPDLTDTQTVYIDRIYLEGKISDDHKVKEVKVNQAPVLPKEGKQIFFSHMAELEEGENEIAIEAEDEAGNKSGRRIRINYELPQALQLDERLKLSVMPFENKGEVNEAALHFLDVFITSLFKLNRFQVVERKQMDALLQELKLSAAGLVDQDSALRLGRLSAAQCILMGSVIESGLGMEIVCRMIDTETAELILSKDVYSEEKDLMALSKMADGLALKIHHEFPLLGGIVLKKKGGQIYTDMGAGKTALNRRLIVYRAEEMKHPVTGKVLGSETEIIGKAKVNQVQPEMSKAEIVSGEAGAVQQLDLVITE